MSPLTRLWASALKSTVGLRLRLERRPLGLEGPGGPSPQAFRPSAQLLRGRLVWGAFSSQVPWELEGVGGGEGISQAPPPRPAATESSGSNIPSPLKGEVTASKLRLSKALQLGEDSAREGRMNTRDPS